MSSEKESEPMQQDSTITSSAPATKTCSKCREVLPLSEYYKDKRRYDGLYPHCKACHYKMTHAYEQTERGKFVTSKSKSEAYWTRGGKGKARALSSKEGYRERRKQYEKTEAGKEASRRKMEKRQREHPEKLKAKTAVRNAVKRGDLPAVRTQLCKECDAGAREYHHESYERERWLDVIALCKRCHAATYTEPYQKENGDE